MKIKFLSLLLAISISGCFGSPAKIAMTSDEGLKVVSTLELCAAYGDKLFRTERVKNELQARLISYQHGLKGIPVTHQYRSGNLIVTNLQHSGIKKTLPDKGQITSEPEKNDGKLKGLMKKKLAEQLPPDGWEWELIEKGEIKKGMTQCGLLASWGKPTHIVKKSRWVSEWIYEGLLSYATVHIRKGKIKKWQK